MVVDWNERADYMFAKHGVTVEQANEALTDPDRVVLDPDPASRSGVSIRTIGYSPTRREIIAVLTVDEDGIVYGINGWPANSTDQRRYRERNA